MPRVVLAPALARWIAPAGTSIGAVTLDVSGATLAAVLEQVFIRYPNLRGYVLDEQGAIRHHLTLFIDGNALRDKAQLTQAVRAELYVMQALSGG